MPKKENRNNPHCSVPGCRAKRPHAENPIVKMLLDMCSDPVIFTNLIKSCIYELLNSLTDDANKGRVLAYFTRLRQSEELYYRTLYVLFIAGQDELPHIFSGKRPNSFSEMWRKVNQVILEGRGTIETKLPDQDGEESSPLEMMHNTAHVSFGTIITCSGIADHADRDQIIGKHLAHMDRLLAYLDHMTGLFKAGRTKSLVQEVVTKLHRPALGSQLPQV
jgi:hypothetical protein